MGAKLDQAWADITATGKDAIADVQSSYNAILTQDSSVPLRLDASPAQTVETGQEPQATGPEIERPDNDASLDQDIG